MELINNTIKGLSLSCTVIYKDGKKEKRKFHNKNGYVGLGIRRSSKRYYPYPDCGIYQHIDKIIIQNPATEKTHKEAIIANGKRFLKTVDKRLWTDLQVKVKDILRNVISIEQEWIELGKKDTFASFFWKKYREEWIYQRKSPLTTINTVFGSNVGKELTEDIKNYLDGQDTGFLRARIRDTHDEKSQYLYYANRTNYDNSFEIHRDTGKAWLSREYKDCGNGHYYILISPTYAVYMEKD
jgi:hypothetical protein